MKRLAIIGANDFQNQLILKAKARGIETHVFAWECGDVGEKTADYFYPISIVEKEQILEKCREIGIDGIISIASDLASVTVNYVAEQLGLTCNGIESSIISTNKYLMRKTFEKNGDPSPKNYRSDEINEEVIERLSFPVIVKPVDRSGSRGITKVLAKEDLMTAIQIAEELSFDKKAMVEEFVEGNEYSVEYISYRGEHHFLAVTKKFTTGAPNFIETGHIQPSGLSEEMVKNVQGVVEHALDSLMIKNGASHSELKIDDNGNIVLIEIGGRMGGDCIGSDLVQISTGYDFVNMVIDVALGEEPSFELTMEPAVAQIKFIFDKEDLKELEKVKVEKADNIYRISEIGPIDDSHEVVDSSTRYGYYILRG